MRPVYQKLDDIVDNSYNFSSADEEVNNSLNQNNSFTQDINDTVVSDTVEEENKPMGLNDMLNNNMKKLNEVPTEEEAKKNNFGINDLLNNLKKH